MAEPSNSLSPWRNRLHEIIFEADTPAGKVFDVGLLLAIILSVLAVCLESVAEIRDQWGRELRILEWGFTVAFTVEYALRLVCVGRPLRYAVSFFGIVDLMSIVPTYLSLILVGSQSLLVIRALRLLRVFRVFKLAHFLGEANVLAAAIRGSVRKVIIFLGTVLTLILILGTLMYLIEGPRGNFKNIPESIYWAIVTMTTVGYGDLTPQTVPGKVLASIVMLMGYAIIAVPTGIVTVELSQAYLKTRVSTQACPECSAEGHDVDAKHCKYCGARL